ncbi:MAG TPA: hypothetical protein VF691_07025, partial [Cytophagaceae bacterium]
MKQLIIFCCLFLSVQFSLFSQADTEFWFAVPYVTKYHAGGKPAYLRISAKSATTVQISQPANNTPQAFDTVFNMPANTTVSIDLTSYLGILTDSFPNQKGDNAIYIKSTNLISAYYEFSANTNAEVFVLKGNENALGTEFYTPFQNTWDTDQNPEYKSPADPGWYRGDAHSTIDIVATEDNTQITIIPKANGVDNINNAITQRPAGVAYTVSLNRGQTYTLQAATISKMDHLFGTHITTNNKKIAVTIKDDTVKEGEGIPGRVAGDLIGTLDYGYDLIGDQIVPTNIVGADYIVLKGFTGFNKTGVKDKVFIIVTENNTKLTVNGVSQPSVYQKGDTVSFKTGILGDAVYISARDAGNANVKKNIYVY